MKNAFSGMGTSSTPRWQLLTFTHLACSQAMRGRYSLTSKPCRKADGHNVVCSGTKKWRCMMKLPVDPSTVQWGICTKISASLLAGFNLIPVASGPKLTRMVEPQQA